MSRKLALEQELNQVGKAYRLPRAQGYDLWRRRALVERQRNNALERDLQQQHTNVQQLQT